MAQTGIITTVAGTGPTGTDRFGFPTGGFGGDGGPATSAQLNFPPGLAVDASGNLFIADLGNHRIRRVDTRTGMITTVAGTGGPGCGGAATAAQLESPRGVALDGAGDLLIADSGNGRIRKVEVGAGIIITVAGAQNHCFEPGFDGDGGPAISARFSFPYAVALDGHNNVFIVDWDNQRIRKIDPTTGIITTVAGNPGRLSGFPYYLPAGGFGGDGGPATSAQLNYPNGVAVDLQANLFIADTHNHRIRKIDALGIITTVAGSGPVSGGAFSSETPGDFTGDGGPATGARLFHPEGLAIDSRGNLFIADTRNHRIRRVDVGTGIITTVAGGGASELGDGGPATSARLSFPSGVTLDAHGNLFIADSRNQRIRKVTGVGAGGRPTITGPTHGSRFSRGAGTPVTFAWAALEGATQYGFEHTGPDLQFANPNGRGPDPVNGFGGAGGGFVVSGMSFSVALPSSAPPGAYQVRVIGLSATGLPVGTFSDAVTMVVE